MKKTVLCIFSLILYLLVACTILCGEVEDSMATHVIVTTEKTMGGVPITLRPSSVFRDENGAHLYEMTEGMGWNSGLLAAEVNKDHYDADSLSYFLYTEEWSYVISASRQPREGEPIIIMADAKELTKEEDTYLLYYPFGVPDFEARIKEGKMRERDVEAYRNTMEKVEIVEKTEQAMVVRFSNGAIPYTEQMAKSDLAALEGFNWQIYRMADIEKMIGSLPLIALVIVVVALPFLIWAFTCILARKEEENGDLIKLNVGLVGGLLIVLLILTKILKLPLALMPLDNIFDMAHYRETFGILFGLLGSMSAGQSILTLTKWMEALFYVLLAAGAVAAVIFVVVECRLVKKGFAFKRIDLRLKNSREKQ